NQDGDDGDDDEQLDQREGAALAPRGRRSAHDRYPKAAAMNVLGSRITTVAGEDQEPTSANGASAGGGSLATSATIMRGVAEVARLPLLPIQTPTFRRSGHASPFASGGVVSHVTELGRRSGTRE